LARHLPKDKEGPPSDGLVFAQLYKLVRLQVQGNPDKTEVTSIQHSFHFS